MEAENLGLRLFVLILKPDLAIGYVIYHIPPNGRAEVIIGSLILKNLEWWEMLDWKTMPYVYEKLPEELKEKIKAASLI